MALFNKYGVEVRLGQVWRDCDKRMAGRTVTVVELIQRDGKVLVSDSMGKRTRISVRRMHPHSTGFELVSGPGAADPVPPAGILTALIDTLAAAEDMGIAVSDFTFEARDNQIVVTQYSADGEVLGHWLLHPRFEPMSDDHTEENR